MKFRDLYVSQKAQNKLQTSVWVFARIADAVIHGKTKSEEGSVKEEREQIKTAQNMGKWTASQNAYNNRTTQATTLKMLHKNMKYWTFKCILSTCIYVLQHIAYTHSHCHCHHNPIVHVQQLQQLPRCKQTGQQPTVVYKLILIGK